jgi:hypothetical protein
LQEVTRAWRLVLVAALAAAALPALAVVLGDVEARSALGEALDARIPFTIPEGSSADASCFAIVRQPGDGPQGLGEGVLTLERKRGERALRIRTLAPVLEPAVLLRIRAACPGEETSTTREYALLLDPRAGSALAPIAAPIAASGATQPVAAAHLNARAGDTLASTAAKVYPNAGEARRRYLELLREANPQLAAQGDDASIPGGTVVALPDLRGIPSHPAVARASSRTTGVRLAAATPRDATPGDAPSASAELPTPKAAPAPRRRSAEKTEPKTAPTSAASERIAAREPANAPAPKRAPARPLPPGPAFVLKLSSAEVDLTPSRKIDDRMRAQLRERLLILDADDQVAAMLTMRNSLKQLEARVAEMQLKLDAMPASLAGRGMAGNAPPVVAKAEPPKVEPPKAEAPKAEPPKVEPPKVEAPKVEPPKPEPPVAAKAEPPASPVAAPVVAAPVVEAPKTDAPKIEPPVVSGEPAPAKAEPAKPAPSIETRPGTRPVVCLPPAGDEGLPAWLWAVAGALVLGALLIGAWLWRRSHPSTEEEWAGQGQITEAVEPLAATPATGTDLDLFAAPGVAEVEQPIEIAAEVRPELASDASLSTRLTENSGELRRRYIEERFPEIQNRTIVLDDATSVIKGARLFYEDGALSRAVELLQFSIEDRPEDVRPWLALFEIFRLERLTGEFAELATRFRDHHGNGEYWPKVQFFGREIDPGNALYKDKPLNTLETIGPREARRLAAGLATVGPASNFDPIAENWLNAPMDFENEVLANELRMKLMTEALLTEQDLIPNPMPALRNVEMFNVV